MYLFLKRAFDIVSSFLVLVAFSWLYLLLIIVNAIATKGAPFYYEERVGKGGKAFTLPKFASMYRDANTHPERYLNEEQMEQWKGERKIQDDPRITKLGKLLRKTSLDELPQVWCIFIGAMSVVGPRPIVREEMEEHYSPDEIEIYVSMRPGLISNWGVHGRNDVSYATGQRQRLELEYFEKRSLGYDLKLIFLAVPTVISCKGSR